MKKPAKAKPVKKPARKLIKKPAKRVKAKKPLVGHFAAWIHAEVKAGRIRLCGCPEKFKGIDCPLCHGTGIARINEVWPSIVDYVENHTRPTKVSDLFTGIM
jgi:hypothetical protein